MTGSYSAMKFYIVTPTFNSLSWLQCCIRSVADQVAEGVEIHHHVQDGGSTDGTPAWLQTWQEEHQGVQGYSFTFESGKDAGMYDALNKAWEKIPSDADVTAHLNSDEQYLPEALKNVSTEILAHPDADILACAFIIVDGEGRYICHRRPVSPLSLRSRVVCELNTCACFHRVSVFKEHGIRFDTRYRSIADMVMYRDIIRYGIRVKALPGLLTSTFAVTGSNLAWTEVTEAEMPLLEAETPGWLTRCKKVMNLWSNLGRRVNDWLCDAPQSYALFLKSDAGRTLKNIKHPTAHWGMRSEAIDED